VGLLLDWVRWWNTQHRPSALSGATPLEAWTADPAPITDVPAGRLARFALEGDGRTRTITTSGVRWHRRAYLAPWMNGHTGTKVTVRHLPHHDGEIEVFDAATGDHLGSAFLASAATPEQIRSVTAVRTAAARRLKADLKAAEKQRRRRFAASTTAAPARPLGSLTQAEAEAELATSARSDLKKLAHPAFVPHGPVPEGWAHPMPRTDETTAPEHRSPGETS
jgi:putative transposase